MTTQLKIMVGLIFTLLTCVPLAAIAVNDLGHDFGIVSKTQRTAMQEREAALKGREIEAGADNYGQYCVGCHGKQGEGIPSVAPAINRRDLLDGSYQKRIGWAGNVPDFLRNTIAAGRPAPSRPDLFTVRMPTWSNQYGGPMRADQVDALVTFMLNWAEDAPNIDAWPPAAATGPRPTPAPGATPAAGATANAAQKCTAMPAQYAGKKLPYKSDDRTAMAQGKQKYDEVCAACHGTRGRGDGTAAASLNPKPRNFTDKQYMQTLPLDCHFWITMEGSAGTGMAPWKSLGEDTLWKIILYERSFSGVY
jgi:mono/diheme cytochrome c family protein